MPPSSAASSPIKVLDCKIEYYVPLVRYALSTAKHLPPLRRSEPHPLSFVRRLSHKIWQNVVLMIGISRQSNVGGSIETQNKPFTRLASHCTSLKIAARSKHTFIYIPPVVPLPFFLLWFRALKTLDMETPANPDVRFRLHCTDKNTFSRICYERSKLSALHRHSLSWSFFPLPAASCFHVSSAVSHTARKHLTVICKG